MLLVKTELKPSAIHGLGCFAAEDIRAGQIVWQLNDQFDISIDPNEAQEFPQATQDFLNNYCYTQVVNDKKIWILCGDHARNMNHSQEPNLGESGPHNEFNVALRDIKAGEELTCNYEAFDSDAPLKLS